MQREIIYGVSITQKDFFSHFLNQLIDFAYEYIEDLHLMGIHDNEEIIQDVRKFIKLPQEIKTKDGLLSDLLCILSWKLEIVIYREKDNFILGSPIKSKDDIIPIENKLIFLGFLSIRSLKDLSMDKVKQYKLSEELLPNDIKQFSSTFPCPRANFFIKNL